MPSLHNGTWWANGTKQFNFTRPDALNAAAFNHLLWRGIKGEGVHYPTRQAQQEEGDEGKAAHQNKQE